MPYRPPYCRSYLPPAGGRHTGNERLLSRVRCITLRSRQYVVCRQTNGSPGQYVPQRRGCPPQTRGATSPLGWSVLREQGDSDNASLAIRHSERQPQGQLPASPVENGRPPGRPLREQGWPGRGLLLDSLDHALLPWNSLLISSRTCHQGTAQSTAPGSASSARSTMQLALTIPAHTLK